MPDPRPLPPTPLQKLTHWLDTVRFATPMRDGSRLAYLYQFPIHVLKEGLLHILSILRRLETEHDAVVSTRNRQYTSPDFSPSFRFVVHLLVMGTPGILVDENLWMEEECMHAQRPGDVRMFRARFSSQAQGRWLTGEMLRHSIEVLVRLNVYVRERIVALRWAVGVAQGDVQDGRMVWWWRFER